MNAMNTHISASHIAPEEYLQKAPSACTIDLRTSAEHRNEHIEGSLHLPLQELDCQRLRSALESAGIKEGETLHLLCQSGARAKMAVDKLAKEYRGQLCIIEGGLNALKQAGFQPRSGSKKTLSLERQVRIATGLLVFLGVVLGTLVHPGFYGLSGFVGAGLMFAGITDTCAMGMLIARMPWNR